MRWLLLRGVSTLVCLVVLSFGYLALGTEQADAYTGAYDYYGYSEVDAAIDYYGLPPIFHTIAWRESGDNPYAVNPYSGACGPFQFLPSTAAAYGYTCWDLYDPYVAAYAARALYYDYGLSPWALTAY